MSGWNEGKEHCRLRPHLNSIMKKTSYFYPAAVWVCPHQECLKIITCLDELMEHSSDWSLRCNGERNWGLKAYKVCQNIEEAKEFQNSFQERAPKRERKIQEKLKDFICENIPSV